MIRSPKHALLYGLAQWPLLIAFSLLGVWLHVVYDVFHLAVLLAVLLGFGIRYLRHSPDCTVLEGALVGLVWAAVSIALDLALYASGALVVDLDVLLKETVAPYMMYPVVTGITLGLLRPTRRTEP